MGGMGMMDEEEMEEAMMEEDPYGEEMEQMEPEDMDGIEQGYTFEALRGTIEKTEDAGKD